MPIFEYRCGLCDNEFESIIFLNESAPDSCPSCGSKKLVKLMSVFGSAAKKNVNGASVDSSCGSCVSSNCSSCK